MQHKIVGRKFGRSSSHRRALLMNLAKSLILNGRIQTTLAKAKDLRPYVEKLVTVAKKGETLTNRRNLLSRFRGDELVVNKLFAFVPSCLSRNGGYTRILRNGFKKGDNSPIGLIEFVDFQIDLSKKQNASADTSVAQEPVQISN